MKKRLAALMPGLWMAFALSFACQAQSLQEKIGALVAGHRAHIGVTVGNAGGTERAAIAADALFPMQSVYKFPIALSVLDRVDRGELSLEKRIAISRSELRPGTWSPLRDRYRKGKTVFIPLAEIVRTTMTDSDNNGCDILLRLAGAPEKVTAFLRRHGVAGMTVATTERAMHGDWPIPFRNSSTPAAATRLLRLFEEKKLLKPRTHAFLWNAMKNSGLSPERLRSSLPPQTPLIHKTGTSTAFYRKQGMTINDMGIIVLPDGQPVFVTVFVSHGKEPKAVTEKMIPDIARVTWRHFTAPKKPVKTRKTVLFPAEEKNRDRS
ncbi:class A beta-lactamase [Oxalobacter paraformigenes]|uniref:Beta-lactamase n=1 Tax=Oxalobacter paraformigenes TaxID=556268 RepID=C3X3G5_9BURK|nr:class A beta-lactamase [Oxalobacter paraformigenes]EEO27751.1 hypothetical protein OFAG_00904 [Oxalobacter paraformigenes]